MTLDRAVAYVLEPEPTDPPDVDLDPDALEGFSNQERLQRLGFARRAPDPFVQPLEENRWWEDLDRWA